MAKKSRNYPFVDLPTAIGLAQVLYHDVQFGFMPAHLLMEAWGLSPTSSTSIRKLAALSHFGLIVDEGVRKDRKVALSPIGKTIILGQEFPGEEYYEALKEAALTPSIYQEVWARFDGKLPNSDRVLRHYALSELELTPSVADTFISDFRSTLEFAGLLPGGVSSRNSSDLFGDTGAPRSVGTSERTSPQPPKASPQVAEGIALTSTDPAVQVIPLPLFNGQYATLNVPKDLSRRDYDHLKKLVNTMLDGMESILVSSQDAKETHESDSGANQNSDAQEQR